jgi:hypothetical protein
MWPTSLSASHFISKKKRWWSMASQMPSQSPFRRTALRIRHACSGSIGRACPCGAGPVLSRGLQGTLAKPEPSAPVPCRATALPCRHGPPAGPHPCRCRGAPDDLANKHVSASPSSPARPPCSSAFAGFVWDAARIDAMLLSFVARNDLPRKGVFST